METLVVTGASGFLGKYILKELEKPEFRDKFSIDRVKLLLRSPEKLKDLKSENYIYEIVKGDLLDHKSIADAVKDVDTVIHVAAYTDYISPKKNKFYEINVEGTEALINAMKPGSKLILISTIGIYGFPNLKESITEDFEPKKPFFHYQKSKKEQEEIAFKLCKEKGIKIISIRPPGIIGPGDYYTIPMFIKSIERKWRKTMLIGRADENYIPFAHAEDVANAILKALDKIEEFDGQSFHLASFSTTYKDILDILCEGLGEKSITRRIPYSLAYFMAMFNEIIPIYPDFTRFGVKFAGTNIQLDITKIKEKLGWKPKFDMQTTIKESLKWYLKENPLIRR